jgi:hypothetical protein
MNTIGMSFTLNVNNLKAGDSVSSKDGIFFFSKLDAMLAELVTVESTPKKVQVPLDQFKQQFTALIITDDMEMFDEEEWNRLVPLLNLAKDTALES